MISISGTAIHLAIYYYPRLPGAIQFHNAGGMHVTMPEFVSIPEVPNTLPMCYYTGGFVPQFYLVERIC